MSETGGLTGQPADDAGSSGRMDAVRQAGLHAQTRWFRWLKWGDCLMYVLIGGLAAILLLAVPRLAEQSGSAAILTLDGQAVLKVSAEQLAGSGTKDLTAYGYHYQISWENGKIRFIKADCPDKICVRTGWIGLTGEIAACVPGHLILKILGGAGQPSSATNEVDVIIK